MSTVATISALLTLNDRDMQSGLGRATKSLEEFGQRMQGVAAMARNVLVVGGGAIAGFVKLGMDAENSVRLLESALASTNQNVGIYSSRLQALASEIQNLTVYDDDFAMGLMKNAMNLGVTADRMEEVIKGSIGLGQALDMDATSAMRAFLQAGQGNFMMLQRQVPALRAATTDAERLAIVQQLAASGFEQAQAAAGTLSGQITQLKNGVGDLGEIIGGIFMPKLLGMVESAKLLVPELQKWVKNNSENIVIVTKLTAAVAGFLYLLPKVIAGIVGIGNAMLWLYANPVAVIIAGIAVAIVGLTLALNDGKLAGMDFNDMLTSLANKLGLVSDGVLKLVDAEDAYAAASKRVADAQAKRDSATNTRDELAAIETLMNAEQGRLDAFLKRKRAENEEIGPDGLKTQKQVMADLTQERNLRERIRDIDAQRLALKERLASEDAAAADADAMAKNAEEQAKALEELAKVRAKWDQEQRTLAQSRVSLMQRINLFGADTTEAALASLRQAAEEMRQQALDLKAAGHDIKNAEQDIADKLADQIGDMQQNLVSEIEDLTLTSDEKAAKALEAVRQGMIERASILGILTDELRERINAGINSQLAEIGKKDDAKADTKTSAQSRVEGLSQMFTRIQQAAATPMERMQQRATDAAVKAADDGAKVAEATEATAAKTGSLLTEAGRMVGIMREMLKLEQDAARQTPVGVFS
jgi:hypothetical protein